ncbi:MAG: acetyl/propionyl/methylcrotonyl-CoA carboxylase subunit alpha [Polyangia bacterium]
MFKSLLIANRGEIACRIILTARRLGIETIAVYSDADATARHVRMADRAYRLGPAAASESYLSIDKIMAAVRESGAAALHPGYGFLSENAELADACAAAGCTFVGPTPDAIRAMGSKSSAKKLMEGSGVPLTPGYHGADQDPALLQREATRIGYPVLIKASAGGGGKGMRRVDAEADFQAALESCKREASRAFGSELVLVEKYIEQPRHIELQIFGDMHGNYVHVFERDCSVQRRHQKVLEEAPAPGMTEARRAQMGEAAIKAARAVSYVGAGTVEFIVDPAGTFFFMEMNTRLQVEHPVTEKITGLDLVEWQLRVAAGEPLPLKQDQIRAHGHALEARIYAENPDAGFVPSTGPLVHLVFPAPSKNVRVDTGVEEGDTITPHYDPMIAKLIVWGEDRGEALGHMERALEQLQIVGVANNVEFLGRLVRTKSFAEARLDTALIEREHDALQAPTDEPADAVWQAAARGQRDRRGTTGAAPWSALDGWRLGGHVPYVVTLRHGETTREVAIDESRSRANAFAVGDRWHVFSEGRHVVLDVIDPLDVQLSSDVREGALRATMPGKVVAHKVAVGDHVKKGTPLMILEAMKMELSVVAPYDGTVRRFVFAPGEQVTEGAELVELERDATK